MTKLTGIIMSENKLTGSLGARNEINVDIIGTGARGKDGKSAYEIWLDLGNEGTEQEYLASLKGQDGYTPVKDVDYFDGEQGLQGIQGEKGEQGPKGDKGDDGYTPIKDIDYFDGKDGKDGQNGVDGKDGYTPVRGVDYYTDDDKAEMVSAVIATLPFYDGEVESV